MKRYYITIVGYGGKLTELYVRARKGLTGKEIADAWNSKRPTRCVAVRDGRTHKLLWAE